VPRGAVLQDTNISEEVALKDYIRILMRRRWIILLSFILVMAVTVYVTFTTPPVYEASALVMVKEGGGVQQKIFDVPSFIKRETSINNQVQILQSRTLARHVIQRLMDSPHRDSLALLGNSVNGNRFSLMAWFRSILSGGEGDEEGLSMNKMIESFREGAISVLPRRDTDIIELKVNAPTPFEAAYVTNIWVDAYTDLDLDESRGEVQKVREFLEQKLEEVQHDLNTSEEVLRRYKEENQVVALDAETQKMITQLTEFESLYQEAATGLEANLRRLDYLKSQLDENQKIMMEKTDFSSPVIRELEKQLAEWVGRRAVIEQQLKEAGYMSGEVAQTRELDQKIRGLQDKITEEMRKLVATGRSVNPLEFSETLFTGILEIEAENKSLKAKAGAFKEIVDGYNSMLEALPEKTLKLARLEREAGVNNTIFMMLREKHEENRIVEAGQIGNVRVVDRAEPPERPIKPKKKMNLMLGFMLGLGAGFGLAFALEYFDVSLKSIEDIERMDMTALGSIPFIASQKVRKKGFGVNGDILDIESRLITHFEPKSPVSEAYRTLRTNIRYARVDSPVKTVLMTSSGPGEGKSTSAANLAIAFAQMGTRTLLVDTDLRRPVLHGIFNVSRGEGLTNVLVGGMTFDEAVRETEIENLAVVTSGTLPPNPSELLASETMGQFIEDAKTRFDMILFDSPPVIAVTDPAVLATRVDGVILVIRSGRTVRDSLARARVLMNNVKADILGILVNGVNTNHMYGSYYHYHYESKKH